MTMCVKDRTSDLVVQGMRNASMVGLVIRVCESCAVQTKMTIMCGLSGLTLCACMFGCVA